MLLRRLLALALAAAVVLLAAAGGARAQAVGDEDGFLRHLSVERSERGLAGLASAPDLQAVARRHAQRMADRGQPYHNPALTSEVEGWSLVGENVGFGPNVDMVHDAFMDSAPHRATIVDARFTEVGVGAVRDPNGRLWVVQVFRRPAAAPAPAAAPVPASPEPADRPAPPPVPEPAPRPAPATVAAPVDLTPTSVASSPPSTATTRPPPAAREPVRREVEVAGLVVVRDVSPAVEDLVHDVPTAAWGGALLLAAVVALQGQALRRLGLLA